MKKKLIGIFVCILLISTSVLPVIGSDNKENKQLNKTNISLNSYDDDVPIWNVGDAWEYRINDIDIELGLEDQPVHIRGAIDNLYFEVTDVTSDSYKLRYN